VRPGGQRQSPDPYRSAYQKHPGDPVKSRPKSDRSQPGGLASDPRNLGTTTMGGPASTFGIGPILPVTLWCRRAALCWQIIRYHAEGGFDRWLGDQADLTVLSVDVRSATFMTRSGPADGWTAPSYGALPDGAGGGTSFPGRVEEQLKIRYRRSGGRTCRAFCVKAHRSGRAVAISPDTALRRSGVKNIRHVGKLKVLRGIVGTPRSGNSSSIHKGPSLC
jgi:hypothetical protein